MDEEPQVSLTIAEYAKLLSYITRHGELPPGWTHATLVRLKDQLLLEAAQEHSPPDA